MSNFEMFMNPSLLEEEIIEYVASKRIGKPVLDKKGEPTGEIIPEVWKLKGIDADLDEAIKKECTKRVPVVGVNGRKTGQYTQETDTDKYIGKLCVACTVYPNLNDSALQDFYKVKSADALLKKMLKSGEYTEYKAKVMEINGYDMSMDELVDEAKN